MSFRLKANEPTGKGVKRLVRKQIDGALDTLGSKAGARRDESVHDTRKRFKKVRALLRLVRDSVGEKVYERENVCFRDAARPLTEVRDAKVLLDTLDKLTDHFAEQVAAEAFRPVRNALRANRRAVRKRVLDVEDALAGVTLAVEAARQRLRDWSAGKGWSALRDGLKRVYKAGRLAAAAAAADPTREDLHEWRKQAKYLWHQLQVLAPSWPEVMGELANQAHELSQRLGDDHDLAVLREMVTGDPATFGMGGVAETLQALIDRRRAELQQEAAALGARLYEDRPRAFVKRLRGYWKAWRTEPETVRTP